MMVAAKLILKSTELFYFSFYLWTKASKLISRRFIMQQDNDPKHTGYKTKGFIRGKVEGFRLAKSIT